LSADPESESGARPLILIHQYFWPDSSPYGNLLRGIAEHLADEGFEVTILTTQPNYGSAQESRPACEQLGKLTVRRTWGGPAKKGALLRIVTSLWFCLFILRKLIAAPRGVRVMCSTMPPVIGATTARWMTKRRGGKFVYHLMDIHPEAAEFVGMVKPNRLTGLLRKVDQSTIRKADAVVALSSDMLDTLRQRGMTDDRHLSVINNYAQPSFGSGSAAVDVPDELRKREGRFRILFAGNIGHFQHLDTVIDAAAAEGLREMDDIEFVFVGEGKALARLQSRSSELAEGRVKFFPRQTAAVAEALAAGSDLCLVTLAENVYRVAFPSKTATCLSAGRPLLVVAEPESELSRLCSEHGAGIACAPGDAEALAKAVAELRADREKMDALAGAAKTLGRERFSRESIFPQWVSLMNSL